MKEIPQTKNKHVPRLLKLCGITKRAKKKLVDRAGNGRGIKSNKTHKEQNQEGKGH